MLHSSRYREPEALKGKRVLIIGIGNSALDISRELSTYAKDVLVSCRHGAVMIPLLSGTPPAQADHITKCVSNDCLFSDEEEN